ncbi:hypothetical protein KSP40_PGU019752 [Platanthera guangdongensis]|uniref:Uncharacterized protein n=1 Tax=Platanthera guangdongensis TaxID=2320717 RepID=A0ABR2MPS8_9ASPA
MSRISGDHSVFGAKIRQGKWAPERRIPADGIAVDQWIEVETQHFNKPISSLFYQHLLLPLFFGGAADEKVVGRRRWRS